MTLDDLVRVFNRGWSKGGESDKAGIQAVVEALRNEMTRLRYFHGSLAAFDKLDEILGSDPLRGEVAGGSTREDERGLHALDTRPAAEFCEWGKEDILGCRSRSCSKHPTPYKPGEFCANCGKPIKFVETANEQ